ncbi:receptor type tyrosine protein phosphatase [Trichuris trichiura]|uniref:Receptor type tyrosine protein phosphatase n=1 Tax=Trichuris trichiura TaxID=36087 RepID=A0A077Z9J9_TRITR|nr:receptor type tyrosine protein phosphatase [Trichuris trichiura]
MSNPLAQCIISYFALTQHYQLDYNPDFCFSGDPREKLNTIREIDSYIGRANSDPVEHSRSLQPQYDIAYENPYYPVVASEEWMPPADDSASWSNVDDNQNAQSSSNLMIPDSNYAAAPFDILEPGLPGSVDSGVNPLDEIEPADYYLTSPRKEESLMNKKDFEEIGIIDQGTGHKEHKIQTRLPDFQLPTESPWYDSESVQLFRLPANIRPPSFAHWISNDRVYIRFNRSLSDPEMVQNFMDFLTLAIGIPKNVTFDNVNVHGNELSFEVSDLREGGPRQSYAFKITKQQKVQASQVAEETYQLMKQSPIVAPNARIIETGVAKGEDRYPTRSMENGKLWIPVLIVSLLLLMALIILFAMYAYRSRRNGGKSFFGINSSLGQKVVQDYEELCRRHMSGKVRIPQPLRNVMGTLAQRLGSQTSEPSPPPHSRSTNSSVSSCTQATVEKIFRTEEPVHSSMDVSTGHMILSYLEDHLKTSEKLEKEWKAMENYKADQWSTEAASLPENDGKNRSTVLPYDQYRVTLTKSSNQHGSDYINASPICDHDPRYPVYVAAEGPSAYTAADFWQMVWEQGSLVIVNLTKLIENNEEKCFQYWPDNRSEVYHSFEVHLVSEHIWCEDYLVRSFYLKNLTTQDTRTVTQFHYLSWPEEGVPPNTKSLLEFRRKVNKSYRSQQSPIIIHCSDGAGRTGTYILIDMVLNRINKGVKELDIAASLEHLRDQRMCMVHSIEQFEFVLSCVADEVQAIVKAIPNQ